MNNSIIIVPYRNRPQHLARFLDHMNKFYLDQYIYIIEQSEEKQFNRAKLLNVGFLEGRKIGIASTFIFHDIDMLPVNADYDKYDSKCVVQLAKSDIQEFDYLGGVTSFSDYLFYKSGGYHNDYFHRAEDNEMMFNLKRLGIKVIEKPATFIVLDHERKGPEFDPGLWRKAQLKRTVQDQLSVCKYNIVDDKKHGNVRHLIVRI